MSNATRKPTSYLRDRDYSTHIEWTYELNKDVYECYKKARSDPSIGYMKRLKKLWDEHHPELSHLNEKQLRQQATFVEKNQSVLSINLSTEVASRQQSPPSDEPRRAEISTENNVNKTVDFNTENFDDEILINSLKSRFLIHVAKYKQLKVHQREYACSTMYVITNHEWNAINIVIQKFISTTHEQVDLWLINVIQYAAIITLLEKHNQLKERKNVFKPRDKPNWQKHLEEKIGNLQRKISYIELIINCRNNNVDLTANQIKVQRKLRRWYGNTTIATLTAKLSLHKHELKVAASQVKHRLKIDERNRINKTFATNQKSIYRGWKSKKVTVDDPPSKENITSFWSNIWCNERPYNRNASWIEKLRETYCVGVEGKNYEIKFETFQKVLNNMKNNGAPGRDLIRCFWIKKLVSTHYNLLEEYKLIFEGEKEIPDWLALCLTILLPKNTETRNAKNYRPIACQNIMYKLFTGIVYTFFEDHCTSNDIITLEQAGGKKGSWGCADQLLINKMVLEEVTSHRRNLFTMWFDYKKAFDMIPHKWLIDALELAKLPPKLISVVENLTKKWSTKIFLNHTQGTIETDDIKYTNGLMQGDCLSLMMFELCVNPLSHLLNHLPGYKIGKPGSREISLSHLFFVDDLKTFANDEKTAKMQLDLITTFTRDIGMEFGADKCAYLRIQRGERKSLGSTFTINELELNELKDGDLYKYLGMDEDVSINGPINKEKVRAEYFRRVRKIWNSELYSRHKITAHNTFAVPVLTPTFGILSWSKDELEQIDVKTRKLLTLSGSFHRNSDVNRLYCHRTEGGRGLNSVNDIYVSRIVSLSLHLTQMQDKNKYLDLVKNHESKSIMRQGNELKQSFEIELVEDPKAAAKKVKMKLKEEHLKTWLAKPQHGYLFKTREKIKDTDAEKTKYWLTKSNTTSHVEGYICAIQEEEINTRGLQKRRLKDEDTNPESMNRDFKCRVCHQEIESIQHVLACCERLRIPLYLPVRHNAVATVIYHLLTMSDEKAVQTVFKNESIELWWDMKIETKPTLEHNKPDLLLWRVQEKTAFVIDVVVGLDINVEKNYKLKQDYYLPMCIALKRLYPEYSFEVIPISLGATGLVMKKLTVDLEKIGIDKSIIKRSIEMTQKAALFGSVKIVKSAMSY